MPEGGFWSKEIGVEAVGGVRFRMYVDRPRNIPDVLQFASLWKDRPYLLQGDRAVRFSGMLAASAAKARALIDASVARGDRVVILGWNSPDWIVNFWACLRIGAIPVLANAWWSDKELEDALGLLQPKLVLADDRGARKVAAKWRLGQWSADETAAPGALPAPAGIGENDPAVIIFTSGTQGRPKAVVLAHRSLLSNQLMILHITRRLPYAPLEDAGDIGLHTGPLFHIGGVHAMIRGVLVGNTIVLPEGRFNPGEALALIERHRIVRWSAVPTMASRLIEHPDIARRDTSSLRAMTLGGSPVHAELMARIRENLPSVQARIATGYGLSENGGQATTASGSDTSAKPGSAGRALPLAEIRVEPRPGLADGEIFIRSPTQMLGYFGAADSPIGGEGWLETGDLGRLDETGHIWITGRSKDIIIRGGENIAPAAVEDALSSAPGVVEASVFGLPHPDLGEEVTAVVVVDKRVTEEALQTHLRRRLASFAIPSRWRLQTEPLPVNQTGKVDKPALRARELAATVA